MLIRNKKQEDYMYVKTQTVKTQKVKTQKQYYIFMNLSKRKKKEREKTTKA